jgi:hypothetical protein
MVDGFGHGLRIGCKAGTGGDEVLCILRVEIVDDDRKAFPHEAAGEMTAEMAEPDETISQCHVLFPCWRFRQTATKRAEVQRQIWGCDVL